MLFYVKFAKSSINLASCSLKDSSYCIPVYVVQVDLIQSPDSSTEYNIQVFLIKVLHPLPNPSLKYLMNQE